MRQLLSSLLLLVGLVSLTAQSEVTYIHTDILGSPIMETNEQGSVISRTRYKPFGETLETPKNDVGYTGHLNDTDLGLTYMQARYYDPLIGRFYSNDPVGYKNVHNFNRYTYGNNNPYKYVDPDGKISEFAQKVMSGTATTPDFYKAVNSVHRMNSIAKVRAEKRQSAIEGLRVVEAVAGDAATASGVVTIAASSNPVTAIGAPGAAASTAVFTVLSSGAGLAADVLDSSTKDSGDGLIGLAAGKAAEVAAHKAGLPASTAAAIEVQTKNIVKKSIGVVREETQE